MISEWQCGFLLRKSSTDVMFALTALMEKFREGQRRFTDDRAPKEEVW